MHPQTDAVHRDRKGVVVELLDRGAVLSRSQRKMLDLAKKVAETSPYNSPAKRHGAVITRGGSVLAVGVNKSRNFDIPPTVEYNKFLSIHAEMDALSRTPNPRGAVIYIARVNVNGQPMYSRPCKSCAEALDAAGVKRVIYTVPD